MKKEIVESMKSAAAILGIEKHQVQAAKWCGCKAFLPGNRIDLSVLKEWFSPKPEPVHVGEVVIGPGPCLDLFDRASIPKRIPLGMFTYYALLETMAARGLVAHGMSRKQAVSAVETMASYIHQGRGDELWDEKTEGRSGKG